MSRTGPSDDPGVASTDAGPGAAAYLRDGSAAPRIGDTIDRYLLVAALGQGAMGVVFRATDGDLRRDVALKLLRGAAGDDRAARTRLLDEARAMARLQHPGVVTVYDVGSAGGHDFVAMELVAGTTLAAWMKQARPWREVVTRFIAAGRGLAAAHAAGVVHRDFKPHNVLCGDDGRVAVADFGLALLPAGDGGDGTGTIAGTPAYMAPEQHAGATVDARTDQFAFCVALFEGVYGARPFTAPTLAGLREAIDRGPVLPPDPPRIPARLRRVISRGLAATPAARHRDLPALLRELERILAARRQRLVAAAAGVVVLGGVAAALAMSRAPGLEQPSCKRTRFAAVWPGDARPAVEDALAAGPDVQRSVLSGLDGYAARWDARWGALCEREPADTPAFHAVASCLLDGRAQAAALIDELPRLTPTTRDTAVDAVERLPEPDTCTASPTAALPADVATRARVRELEAALARVRGRAGGGDDTLREARRIVDEARLLGFRPLTAAALTEQASIEVDRGDLASARSHLGEAALLAEAAGASEARALALVLLAELEASFSSDGLDQAHATRQAAAAIEAAPAPPRLRARLLVVQARLAQAAGRLDDALGFVDEAIALRERGGTPLAAAGAVQLKGRILRARDDASGALTAIDQFLPRAIAAGGPSCGPCTAMRFEAAFALHDLGRHAEAQARADEALALDPPPPSPPGPRRLTGRVLDRARRPVAGAALVAMSSDLRGDPTALVQPADRHGVAMFGARATTGADGRFTLQVADAPVLVVAERPDTGRSRPANLVAGDTAAELTLVLEPWATVEGVVTTTPADTHVHLEVLDATAAPSYRVEVPVIAGRWRARVPAVPHDVRLVRSDVRFEANLAVATARPRPGTTVAVTLAAPGDVVLVVRVRGDVAVEVPHAGLMMFPGHRGERTMNGGELMRAFLEERTTSRATETTPDGEGGSAVSLTAVTPGPYTVCVAAVPGDLHDPSMRARVMAHAELLEGPCRHVTVTAAPARQEVTIEVPPPRRLPDAP